MTTALIARAGYWTGAGTVPKETAYDRYDTYENRELVELNQRLFVELGFDGALAQRFDPAWEALFDGGYERVDRNPYEVFLRACSRSPKQQRNICK
ncbi:MAG: hypothetical protein GKR94_11900 [Gammaproteobacteria bacterium]|nr:hypothetical protein [Gammaproteobacteria bacterium]